MRLSGGAGSAYYRRIGRRSSLSLLAGLAALAVLVFAAGPSFARVVESELAQVVERGVSSSVTYQETNHGKAQGNVTAGVVGHGTFSTKLTPSASVAASLLSAVKSIPVKGLLAGGSYVVRFDIEANGGYRGLLVARFAAHGLGSVCLSFSIVHGKFVPGSSFVPASGEMMAVGGTGAAAALHGSARFNQKNVVGSATETFLESGKLKSISTGTKVPLNRACQAVAKLA